MNKPQIGVAIIVEDYDDKILMLKRKGSLGENTWGFPGGKLEMFETIEDCAIRELKEETNLDIVDLKFDRITNDIFIDENLHFVTIFIKGLVKSYDAKIMETDKCSEIKWFNWNKLPKKLFLPVKNYIKGNDF